MNELVTRIGKETITSLELLEKINEFRKMEYKTKTENGTLTKAELKRGHFVEMEHRKLKRIILQEFNEENIFRVEYIDKKGEKREMLELTFRQAIRVASRESIIVRDKVFKYIERLENELKNALERERLQVRAMGKALRNLETSTIQRLLEYGNIPKEKWKLYFANYTMIAYRIMGYKKKPERDEMNAQELSLLQQLETVINVTIIENISKNVPHYLIYQDCRDKATEVFRKVRSLFISEIDKATQRGFELMEQEQY